MRVGRLIARLVIGGLFIGHGLQKLTNLFGGSGVEGTTETMKSLRMYPAKPQAVAAGVAETGGGALLAAGLFTPLAAAGITAVMLTAIRTVHGPKGPWNTDGGWEFNAVMIAAPLALTDAGPGPLSLDRALGTERCGPKWTLGALGAGALGSALAVEAGHRLAPEPINTAYA